MKPDMTIVAGDRLPELTFQCLDENGKAVDLTGADAVNWRIQPSDRSRQASVTPAEILNARGGFVSHLWTDIETALPCFLLANVVVTRHLVRDAIDLVGINQTYPPDRYITIEVIPRLAPP